ncbi:DUF2975 domain-containing protein [Roseibium sp. HPY-6]|uniref:DUF2975 domain-containing protein n=1 Tax=Roseibium sp. HPY-6 TaxID=3229852 RepID=UPI00338DBAF9
MTKQASAQPAQSFPNGSHVPDGYKGREHRLSKGLRIMCIVSMVGMIVAGGLFAVWPEHLVAFLDQQLAGTPYDKPMPDWKRTALAAVFALPWAVGLYVLWLLARLFNQYANGYVFSLTSCRLLRRIGIAMLLSAVLAFLTPTLSILIATMDNAPGERQLALQLSSSFVFSVIVGGLLLVIGQIMTRAVELDEENRSFV